MTNSESKFREYLKKELNDPKAFIKKLADAKQGTLSNNGMPDYLVISKGRTIWFEVKLSHTKTTFNLSDIRESQYIVLDKMHNAGATIFMAIYVDKELYIVPYMNVSAARILSNTPSINIKQLMEWRIKW